MRKFIFTKAFLSLGLFDVVRVLNEQSYTWLKGALSDKSFDASLFVDGVDGLLCDRADFFVENHTKKELISYVIELCFCSYCPDNCKAIARELSDCDMWQLAYAYNVAYIIHGILHDCLDLELQDLIDDCYLTEDELQLYYHESLDK